MSEELATGGYLTGWNDAKDFQPDDEEFVIIHAFGWAEWYGETAIYHENTKLYQRGNFRGSIEEDAVDYWMHIPAIPGSKADLAQKRRQELERQKCGMTSEEISDEIQSRIRRMIREAEARA